MQLSWVGCQLEDDPARWDSLRRAPSLESQSGAPSQPFTWTMNGRGLNNALTITAGKAGRLMFWRRLGCGSAWFPFCLLSVCLSRGGIRGVGTQSNCNPNDTATRFAMWRSTYGLEIEVLERLNKTEPSAGHDWAALEAQQKGPCPQPARPASRIFTSWLLLLVAQVPAMRSVVAQKARLDRGGLGLSDGGACVLAGIQHLSDDSASMGSDMLMRALLSTAVHSPDCTPYSK